MFYHRHDLKRFYLLSENHVSTYSLVIGLVAVVAGGQVSHSRDGEATTFGGIRVLLAAVVAQALEQTADHVLVVADEVRVLSDVVAIPAEREGQC